jgi:hypothetical protein
VTRLDDIRAHFWLLRKTGRDARNI